MRFKNGSNKVVIELRAVQFWSEIMLVISNRPRAARSFDFEITRMISDQIAIHSVQLPLCITRIPTSRTASKRNVQRYRIFCIKHPTPIKHRRLFAVELASNYTL